MKKKNLFILAILLLNYSGLLGQNSVDVTDQTLKVGAMKTEEMYIGFAEGDKITFNFTEIDNKELKEIEIIEYPSSSKFSDYKTSKIENKTFNVSKTSVYKFRFYNSSLSGRICKIKIERTPATDLTKNFNSNVSWIMKQDTTWNTFTKEVIVGYDTTYIQKTKKELISVDTSIIELFNKNERVFSETKVGGSQYSYVNVNLPANTFTPNKFSPYQSKELISWSYWLGVGQKANEEYDKANNNMSKGITALGTLTGYGALASLAVTGISMFGTPTVGDNVHYKFIPYKMGLKKPLTLVMVYQQVAAMINCYKEDFQFNFTMTIFETELMST